MDYNDDLQSVNLLLTSESEADDDDDDDVTVDPFESATAAAATLCSLGGKKKLSYRASPTAADFPEKAEPSPATQTLNDLSQSQQAADLHYDLSQLPPESESIHSSSGSATNNLSTLRAAAAAAAQSPLLLVQQQQEEREGNDDSSCSTTGSEILQQRRNALALQQVATRGSSSSSNDDSIISSASSITASGMVQRKQPANRRLVLQGQDDKLVVAAKTLPPSKHTNRGTAAIPVVQIDANTGKAVGTFATMTAAAEAAGCCRGTVARIVKGSAKNDSINGWKFCYASSSAVDNSDNTNSRRLLQGQDDEAGVAVKPPGRGKHINRGKAAIPVVQIDVKTGKAIKTFASMSAAAKAAGCRQMDVARTVKGTAKNDSINGYRFRYASDSNSNNSSSNNITASRRSVAQQQQANSVQHKKKSVRPINRSTGKAAPAAAARRGSPNCKSDSNTTTPKKLPLRGPRAAAVAKTARPGTHVDRGKSAISVVQIDAKSGKHVGTFSSMTAAGDHVGTSRQVVAALVRGTYETDNYNGWTFQKAQTSNGDRKAAFSIQQLQQQQQPSKGAMEQADAESTYKYAKASVRVQQIDFVTKKCVGTFNSMTDAAKHVGTTRFVVSALVKGTFKTDNYKGWTFRHAEQQPPEEDDSIIQRGSTSVVVGKVTENLNPWKRSRGRSLELPITEPRQKKNARPQSKTLSSSDHPAVMDGGTPASIVGVVNSQKEEKYGRRRQHDGSPITAGAPNQSKAAAALLETAATIESNRRTATASETKQEQQRAEGVSYDGGQEEKEEFEQADDYILYPAGGEFNQLREQQTFLSNLLDSNVENYYKLPSRQSQCTREFIRKSILDKLLPKHLKVYDARQEKVIKPDQDEVITKLMQNLRDRKKAMDERQKKKLLIHHVEGNQDQRKRAAVPSPPEKKPLPDKSVSSQNPDSKKTMFELHRVAIMKEGNLGFNIRSEAAPSQLLSLLRQGRFCAKGDSIHAATGCVRITSLKAASLGRDAGMRAGDWLMYLEEEDDSCANNSNGQTNEMCGRLHVEFSTVRDAAKKSNRPITFVVARKHGVVEQSTAFVHQESDVATTAKNNAIDGMSSVPKPCGLSKQPVDFCQSTEVNSRSPPSESCIEDASGIQTFGLHAGLATDAFVENHTNRLQSKTSEHSPFAEKALITAGGTNTWSQTATGDRSCSKRQSLSLDSSGHKAEERNKVTATAVGGTPSESTGQPSTDVATTKADANPSEQRSSRLKSLAPTTDFIKSNSNMDVVPFCALCNRKTVRPVHHAWCPKNALSETSGASDILARIRKGIQLGCDICAKEYESGRPLRKAKHSVECRRHRKKEVSAKSVPPQATHDCEDEAECQSFCGGDDENDSAFDSPSNSRRPIQRLVVARMLAAPAATIAGRQKGQTKNNGKPAAKEKKAAPKEKIRSNEGRKLSKQPSAASRRQPGSVRTPNESALSIQPTRPVSVLPGDRTSHKGHGVSDMENADEVHLHDSTDKVAIVWVGCENVWGVAGHADDDAVLFSTVPGVGQQESPFSLQRYELDPFSGPGLYRRTHVPPEAGYQAIVLKRDALATRPWGFSCRLHEHGGACLVSSVEPFSPSEAASLLGAGGSDSSMAPLRVNDMILAVNGKSVGGMTITRVEIEQEESGCEMTLLVSRYQFAEELQETIDKGDQSHLAEVDRAINDHRTLGWIDLCAGSDFSNSRKKGSSSSTGIDQAESVVRMSDVGSIASSMEHSELQPDPKDSGKDTIQFEKETLGLESDKAKRIDSALSAKNRCRSKFTLNVSSPSDKVTSARKPVSESATKRLRSMLDEERRKALLSQEKRRRTDPTDSNYFDDSGCGADESAPDEFVAGTSSYVLKHTKGSLESNSEAVPSSNSERCDQCSGSESAETDDGNAWAGCICGVVHDISVPVLWIQCECCRTWYNASESCLGFLESEASSVKDWVCWGCPVLSLNGDEGGHSQISSSQPRQELVRSSEDKGYMLASPSLPIGDRVDTHGQKKLRQTTSSDDECEASLELAYIPFAKGALVSVREHGWRNVSNPAGIAKVVRSYMDDDGDQLYDIKYVIGRSTTRGVLPEYLSAHEF